MSAYPDLVNIPDNPAGGLTTSGLVGRHIHTEVLNGLQQMGVIWRDNVINKPAQMPNHLVITGASMRWGGMNPPHLTHKWGGAVDIRPIGTQPGPVQVGDAHYSKEGTQALVDILKAFGATRIVFGESLNGVDVVNSSHKNHLHVSFLTEFLEPWSINHAEQKEFLDFEGETWIDYENAYDDSYFIPVVNNHRFSRVIDLAK